MDRILVFVGAGLTIFWGVSHLFPTKNVVAGFGEISAENKRVITMEWINEGVTLIFMGMLAALVMWIDPFSLVAQAVRLLTAIGLLTLAIVSVFTGFRISFLPHKLCPVIFTVSAVLIGAGAVL